MDSVESATEDMDGASVDTVDCGPLDFVGERGSPMLAERTRS